MCREMLFEICKRHGVYPERKVDISGRKHQEKQDFIIENQTKVIAKQEQEIARKRETLTELSLKLDDVEVLTEEVAEAAYQKAVETVTDTVRLETQKADLQVVADMRKWVGSPELGYTKKEKMLLSKCLDVLHKKMENTAKRIIRTIRAALQTPKVKSANKEKIKEAARESVIEKLKRLAPPQTEIKERSNRVKKQEQEL